MAGKSVECVLEHTENKQLKGKSDEIKAVAKGALSEIDVFKLKELTTTIKNIDEQIKRVEAKIQESVNKKDIEVVSSVPGVGERSAAAILAEIGDAKRFRMVSRLLLGRVWRLLFISLLA